MNSPTSPTTPTKLSPFQRTLPWLFACVCVVASLAWLRSPGVPKDFDWNEFGKLPVSAEGRTKPLDSVARASLLKLSGKSTLRENGATIPAIAWLGELLAAPSKSKDHQVFRIDHPEVLSLLGLQNEKRTRFSFSEIEPKLSEVEKQAQDALERTPKQRDPFQRAILALDERVSLFANLARMETPYVMAPLAPGEEWRPLTDVVVQRDLANHASASAWVSLLGAIASNDPAGFNGHLDAYRATLNTHDPALVRKSSWEVAFNAAEPFYTASALYVLAFLLACAGLLMGTLSHSTWGKALSRSALAVILVTFVVHTIAIASRMYLQGRPPVTNLYSSAIFIAWACVPMALTLEWFFRLGLGNIAASLIGFASLVIAHNLSTGGDTMQMMQAVLDSNFWLATHVVVITIGYSAAFLAGILGGTYLILGVCTRLLKGELGKALPKMTYGVLCFASLASFVGTVLGGIWADQSWGRFWGWDPKENGAILIVLMCLLTLHARWGGMVKERGVAVLAVLGNIVTSWSWFGTNMLGVGLHAYGFMDSAVFWLLAFVASQLLIMSLGFVPVRSWRSFRSEGGEPVKTQRRQQVAHAADGADAKSPSARTAME